MPNSSSFFVDLYTIKEPFAPESMINFSNSSGDRSFFWFRKFVFSAMISFLFSLKLVFNIGCSLEFYLNLMLMYGL